jgi:hypothetical protein
MNDRRALGEGGNQLAYMGHDWMTGTGGTIYQSTAYNGLFSIFCSFLLFLVMLKGKCCTVPFLMSPLLCQGREKEKLLLLVIRNATNRIENRLCLLWCQKP